MTCSSIECVVLQLQGIRLVDRRRIGRLAGLWSGFFMYEVLPRQGARVVRARPVVVKLPEARCFAGTLSRAGERSLQVTVVSGAALPAPAH